MVIPNVGVQKADIGIKGEKIGAIAQSIPKHMLILKVI